LVSYDASGNLHVLDVSQESISEQVPKAITAIPSVVSTTIERTREVIDTSGSLLRQAGYTVTDAIARASGAIEQAIPDPKASLDKLILYGGLALVVYAVLVARKS
jgi:phage-related protein